MSDLFKYPRTPHLPWSPGGAGDDTYLIDTDHFIGKEVVVTEKMDGENTSMYRDTIHARSVDGRHHPSRDWVKALHGRIAAEIPDGWRLCGENLYARHSIPYTDLPSYFYLFSVWNGKNEALSWDETTEWAALLQLDLVPVLFRGEFDTEVIRNLEIDTERQEGYVVRTADRFDFESFPQSIAKWVRKGHVQTDQHWMFSEIIPNELSHDAD
ncbi:MAG: RNA ligase family protein [Verrucomicrobiales bacterium]|nr:RNA ligase family protein [Verrucomicrobiales bacterium]